MKGTGLILILVSCSGLGFQAAGVLHRRIKECQMIEQCFLRLVFEIRYGQLPMAEALRQAANQGNTGSVDSAAPDDTSRHAGNKNRGMSCGYYFAEFLLRTASRLERRDNGTFRQIWQEELEGYLQRSILQEEGALLQGLGTQFGSLDLEEQCLALERFLQRWQSQIRELQEQEKRKGHLYRSLGICAGLFLVLILI